MRSHNITPEGGRAQGMSGVVGRQNDDLPQMLRCAGVADVGGLCPQRTNCVRYAWRGAAGGGWQMMYELGAHCDYFISVDDDK
jgi:hypothetical protein